MSEYDDLIEGYQPSVLATEDPGPLTDEEFQRMVEMAPRQGEVIGFVPEPEPPAELRSLKTFEIAIPGTHYVIYEGMPRAVVKTYPISEDAYVSANLASLPNPREDRARRYLQVRYRGFLCGDIANL